MIRTSGDIPELSDMHDITIIVARMHDRDKYFYTHKDKQHTIKSEGRDYRISTTKIVFNNNWLVEKGVLRYEIWVADHITNMEWMWKHTNNGITVTHSMPNVIKLKYDQADERPNGTRG